MYVNTYSSIGSGVEVVEVVVVVYSCQYFKNVLW